MATTETKFIEAAEQEATMRHVMLQSIQNLLHDILYEVHQEEKLARMQTAVVEVEVRAEKLGKSLVASEQQSDVQDDNPVETKAATAAPGNIQLKGNPMSTVKEVICPNCRLPRLFYPRVGFNSRLPPEPTQQYCKSEPVIIYDKHDVHGQRKKGVKVKGQAKGKNKKGTKNEGASPVSNNSDPLTPSSMVESFEFKEIDYPAAKCPNRNSHLGDHWKAVNLFATHLNGSCWLRRDRAAKGEATVKINSTPKDSRANSPKPTVTNGTLKRKAEDDTSSASGSNKKKQKTSTAGIPSGDLKKSAKKSVPGNPSKLREETSNLSPDEKEESASPEKKDKSKIKTENADTIQVVPKAGHSTAREMSVDSTVTSSSAGKLKFNSPSGSKAKGKTKK